MGYSSQENKRLVKIGVGPDDSQQAFSGIEKKLTYDEEIICVFRGSGSFGDEVIRLMVFTSIRIITSNSIAFDVSVTSYPWRSITSWTMNPAGKSMCFTCIGVNHSIQLESIINYSKNLYGFPDLSAAERSFLKFAIS